MRRFVATVAWLVLANPAQAQVPEAKSGQSCVDVSVGQAQSYDCINQQLGALAAQQHRAAEPDGPATATSPANETGQFDEAATRNRLGRNFGHSVTPERVPSAPASAFPRRLHAR